MIGAQQYYVEHNTDLNHERLLNLLPNYIPDYCLVNAEKSIERWNTLIIQAYKKVRKYIYLIYRIKPHHKIIYELIIHILKLIE